MPDASTRPEAADITVAYLLLAHEDAATVAGRVGELLTIDPTGRVVVHLDRNTPAAQFDRLAARLADVPRAELLRARAASGWGQFGLVQAALNGLRALARQAAPPDFVHLTSTACAPIRPIGAFKRFLAAHPNGDFIESAGPEWIVGGLREERWTLHHPFHERRYKWAFDAAVQVQRALGVRRRPPDGIVPRFGSQWWTLSWPTCAALLAHLDARPDVLRFFATTWVADELFFQSLVPHVAPDAHRPGHNLTYYKFTNQGKPLVFYDDHEAYLTSLPYFFARKLAPGAVRLRRRLLERAAGDGPVPEGVGRHSAAYATRMQAQSGRPVPGQAFFASQLADDHRGLLAANRRPYLAVVALPQTLDRLADDLGERASVLRLPPAADERATARIVGTLAPAQRLARHVRDAGGEAVALLDVTLPSELLEAVLDDWNATVALALPPADHADALERLLRTAVVAATPSLRATLAADASLRALDADAVLRSLTADTLRWDVLAALMRVRRRPLVRAESGWLVVAGEPDLAAAYAPALDAAQASHDPQAWLAAVPEDQAAGLRRRLGGAGAGTREEMAV